MHFIGFLIFLYLIETKLSTARVHFLLPCFLPLNTYCYAKNLVLTFICGFFVLPKIYLNSSGKKVKSSETSKVLNEKLDSVIERSNAKRKLLKKILTHLSKDDPALVLTRSLIDKQQERKEE